MSVTGNPAPNLIDQLSGIGLNGGFTIGARMVKQPGQTGGHFSVGYECSSPTGQSVFLKALDLSMALREADVILALQRLTDGVQCEMELLESCRRMDRVVTAVAFGTLRSLNGAPLAIPIPYIIFERATGTARNIVKASSRPADDWCLVTLHHIATGMRQLHGQMISHSDLKLSNVLMFDQNRGAKIADLGRSVRQGRSVWYDAVEWPGDYSYAPPEVAYSFLNSDFTVRRLSADLLAYREDSPENRTFNRSCHVGGRRGGDLLQSRAGYKQVSAEWTTRNTARGLSTRECQNPSRKAILPGCLP